MAVQGKPNPGDTAGWGEDRWCPGRWDILTDRAPSLREAAGGLGRGQGSAWQV